MDVEVQLDQPIVSESSSESDTSQDAHMKEVAYTSDMIRMKVNSLHYNDYNVTDHGSHVP